jgi:hypothetical protein
LRQILIRESRKPLLVAEQFFRYEVYHNMSSLVTILDYLLKAVDRAVSGTETVEGQKRPTPGTAYLNSSANHFIISPPVHQEASL